MKKRVVIIGLIMVLLGIGINAFTKKSFNTGEASIVNKTKEKSKEISKYIDTLEGFVEEIDFKDVVEIVSKENNQYKVELFDYEKGNKLKLSDIIKDEDAFMKKLKELLYLKYPKFIADVLVNNENNAYYFKSNELVIYYYDWVIEPSPREELFLHVNYNEIKDYLKINCSLDSTYEREDGNKLDVNKKLVAITFDDGPGSYTNRLLDILIANKARSTFFMLGKNISHFKEEVKKAYNSKMEIAYHSYAHMSFKRQNIEDIKAELIESNKALKALIGEEFKYIRPPYGAINENIKEALDYPFILWSVDTLDWRYKDIDYLVNYTLENVKDGSIVLFHDIHNSSVNAIEKLLPELYVAGYQVVTVSDLASAFNETLESHQTYRYFTR